MECQELTRGWRMLVAGAASARPGACAAARQPPSACPEVNAAAGPVVAPPRASREMVSVLSGTPLFFSRWVGGGIA